MEKITWVETLARNGQVTARFRCAGPQVCIGRGYRNDIVLDDPGIAVDHLRITRGEDGAILAQSTSAENNFTIAGKSCDRSLIDGDTVIQIGHTLLRIRDADYPVPAIAARPQQNISWRLPSLLVVTTCVLTALTLWLTDFSEPKFSRYVLVLAGAGLILIIWAALWSIFSRIFSGAANFDRHLAIAFAAVIGYILFFLAIQLIAFSFSAAWLTGNAPSAVWLLLGGVAFLHLRAISSTRLILKTAVLGAIVGVSILLQFINQSDLRRAGGDPPIARTNFPPAFRVTRPESDDQFFANLSTLKSQLDSERNAAP